MAVIMPWNPLAPNMKIIRNQWSAVFSWDNLMYSQGKVYHYMKQRPPLHPWKPSCCPRRMGRSTRWPSPVVPEVQELAVARWFAQALPHCCVHICCDNHCLRWESKENLVKEGECRPVCAGQDIMQVDFHQSKQNQDATGARCLVKINGNFAWVRFVAQAFNTNQVKKKMFDSALG